jgi:opacity protein-like surface antigen
MGNFRKTLGSLLALGLLLVSAPLLAQSQAGDQAGDQTGSQAGSRTRVPTAAATVPIFEVSAGYAYVNLEMPSASRVNLNGADGNIVLNITERWGATLDSSYSRTGDVLSTGHGGSNLNFLAGPVFYLADRGNARIFVNGLVGASRVDSAVPTGPTTFLGGQVTRLSFAFGAGVEYDLSRSFGVRGGADYLRTTFIDSTGKDQGQNNLRVVVGLVFKLGNR